MSNCRWSVFDPPDQNIFSSHNERETVQMSQVARATVVSIRAARARSRRQLGVIMLFVVPALALYSVYTLYPVALSIWWSLLDWNGIAPASSWA